MRILKLINKFSAITEDETLLRKWHEPEYISNGINTTDLLKLDIIPIQKPTYKGYKSFIGRGFSSYVIEATYKGKHVAVKITESKKDIDMLTLLNNLRNDKSISKNIIKVYDIKTISKFNKTIYIAIVEFLFPLSMDIALDITTDKSKQKSKDSIVLDRFKVLLYNKETLEKELKCNISDECFNSIKNGFESIKNNENDSIKNDLFHLLLRHTNAAGDTISSTINNLYVKLPILLNEDCSIYDRLIEKCDPRVGRFVKTLQKLKSKYGITYRDMNTKNIMQRPGTGDLVISDSGEFLL